MFVFDLATSACRYSIVGIYHVIPFRSLIPTYGLFHSFFWTFEPGKWASALFTLAIFLLLSSICRDFYLLYAGSVGLLKVGLFGAEGVELACLSILWCLSLPKSISVFLCKWLIRVCTGSGRIKRVLVHFDQILSHVCGIIKWNYFAIVSEGAHRLNDQ